MAVDGVSDMTAGTIQPLPDFDGPAAWHGPEMAASPERWVHVLSPAEVEEIDTAVARLADRDIDVVDIQREEFPLPTLAPTLARIREAVLRGQGFFLLRGLPTDRYSRREVGIAFFGLGAHWGEAVSQNARGHALGHVTDLGFDYSQPTSRGYQTAARLPYHCDASDLVGLLCLKTARAGGLSSIVSSVTLFNEMARRRPDLARILMQPVYRDRRGEIPDGMGPWYAMPVFNLHRGRVLTSYVRSTVRKAQRFDDVPRLTAAQTEAMDLLDAMAEDPAYHLDMTFRPGDIQLLNNHTILHSRTGYEDAEEKAEKRHLMRLWLACDDGPPLPEAFRNYQGLTAAGRPNGYLLKEVRLNAPLHPEDGGPGASQQRVGGAAH